MACLRCVVTMVMVCSRVTGRGMHGLTHGHGEVLEDEVVSRSATRDSETHDLL